MKTMKIFAAIAAVVCFATTNVNAQSQSFDMHKALSNKELRKMVNERPWMLGVYQASKGQDIDLTTMVVTDDKYKGEDFQSTDTTVFWKIKPYTGWFIGVNAGVSTDFADGDQPNNIGGVAEIGLGYAARKYGLGAWLGYSGMGSHGKFGYYTLAVKPYYTPWRGGTNDQRRLDIGAIAGVMQATSKSFDMYQSEDGTIWGDATGSTTAPRFMYGAFIRYEWRQFMGGHRFGIELAGMTYNAKSSYSYYFDNVSTGEVLADRTASMNTRHFNIQLKFTWAFGLSKSKNNYK